jgi:phosphoglucosamine mutase
MSRLFGTDGVRGLANGLLTAELALQLAQAAAVVLGHDRNSERSRPRAVVASDPRASGEFIAAAVEAGLSSSGVDVYDAGVLPTPAAAYLVADLDADFGVMISASHNPAPDNGIKFFARGGQKLPDEVEDAIEAQMSKEAVRPVGADVGRIQRFSDAEDRYIVHLLQTLPHNLDGLKVVLDCAHGAASGCSPQVFKDAGADVVVIGADPGRPQHQRRRRLHPPGPAQGSRGGSTRRPRHRPRRRRRPLPRRGPRGQRSGRRPDHGHPRRRPEASGKLRDDVLVATVMSNLGLKIALREAGISIRETAVGDRYVLEEMRDGGFNLGGEQSGHVIFADHATTGDGVLTGLQLAAQIALTGKPLKELATVMTKLPQVLINVKGVDRTKVTATKSWPRPWQRRKLPWVTPAASCSAPPAPNPWSG